MEHLNTSQPYPENLVEFNGFSVPDFTVYIADAVEVKWKMLFSQLIKWFNENWLTERSDIIDVINLLISCKIQYPEEDKIGYMFYHDSSEDINEEDGEEIMACTFIPSTDLNVWDVVSITQDDIQKVMIYHN